MEEDTLNLYLTRYPDLAAFMACKSQNMMMFVTAEGGILWANTAFLRWSGYTLAEFTREQHPVGWRDISVRDESLEADIKSIEKLKEGKLSHYIIRKFYVPKNGSPQFVELFVRRYPNKSEDQFAICVIEVSVLHDSHQRMALEYEAMSANINATLASLAESNKLISEGLQNQLSSGLNGIISWLVKHPLVGVPVAVVLVMLLFGERAVEVLTSFIKIGGGS